MGLIKNFKLLFHWLANKDKYLKKERETTPFAIYSEVKLVGRTYHSRILNAQRFSQFLDLVREYITLTDQEDEQEHTLGFDATITTQNYPYLKEKLQFQEMYVLHQANNTYPIDDTEETYYMPYGITFHDKFLPQNYFITYLPDFEKIEILTHDLQEFSDEIPIKQQVKEQIKVVKTVSDYAIIQKIEQSFDGFYQFIEEAVLEYRAVNEKKRAEKQAELFATTDVLQRAKALYNVLKIPQHEQEQIYYKGIENERSVLSNEKLKDADYIFWEEIHWCDKEEMTLVENFLARYNLKHCYQKVYDKHPFDTHTYNFMLEIGREVLQNGKLLCCFQYDDLQYIIIDPKDKVKLKAIAEKLAYHSEFEDLIFFDEVAQNYPLPIDLFDMIFYEFICCKNRSLYDIQADLLKHNDIDFTKESLQELIVHPLPIYTDIKVKIAYKITSYNIDETLVLVKPKSGFTLLNLLHQLEQKITQIVGKTDDVFYLKDFQPKAICSDTYILTIEVEKQERLQTYKDLTQLLIADKNRQNVIWEQAKKLCQNQKEDWDILYSLKTFASDMNIHFIIHLDWKSPIEELDDCLREVLKDTYPKVKIKLPTAKNFDEEDAVGTEGVFVAYDKVLRKKGLQFGFFDTQGDDYLLIVHKITDQEKVETVISKIGFGYFEM